MHKNLKLLGIKVGNEMSEGERVLGAIKAKMLDLMYMLFRRVS